MFRSIADRFNDIKDAIIDRVSEFFGGKETEATPQTIREQQEINTDEQQEISQDREGEDYEEEDFDDEEDEDEGGGYSYSDVLDDYDRATLWGENAEAITRLDDPDLDPDAVRAVRYSTPEEAQNFLDEAGLAAFSEIIYIEDEDLFTIAVYDSPGAGE